MVKDRQPQTPSTIGVPYTFVSGAEALRPRRARRPDSRDRIDCGTFASNKVQRLCRMCSRPDDEAVRATSTRVPRPPPRLLCPRRGALGRTLWPGEGESMKMVGSGAGPVGWGRGCGRQCAALSRIEYSRTQRRRRRDTGIRRPISLLLWRNVAPRSPNTFSRVRPFRTARFALHAPHPLRP